MSSETHKSKGKWRKWMRIIHRDLSCIFAGMLLVYLISGIALNHKDHFNSQYHIERTNYQWASTTQDKVSQAIINQWLSECGMDDMEIQHYFPDSTTLKVFLRGNSQLTVSLDTGMGVVEQVKKRPILGSMSKLHYNPGKAWTWFSDIFGIAMLIVVLSGIMLLNGKHSIIGIRGIELLIGMLIPILFMILG